MHSTKMLIIFEEFNQKGLCFQLKFKYLSSYTVRFIKLIEIQCTNALDLGKVVWNGR